MTRQEGGSRDRHRPEAGDDAFLHVHGDRDRRPLRRASDGDQEDPRRQVGHVVGTTAGHPPETAGHPAETRAERPTEHEGEQEQEDDRDAGDEEQHRVPTHVANVAPHHRGGVRQVDRKRVHRAAAFRSSS
jgi:hypothetical protein